MMYLSLHAVTEGEEVKSTCSCPFTELRSSAFFSRDWTHTFLFCLQREAAARLRSRNLRRFSSGSSLVVLRRRPPVLGGFGAGGTGETWTIIIKLLIIENTHSITTTTFVGSCTECWKWRNWASVDFAVSRWWKLLQGSLWWRWLAVEGDVEYVPQWRASEKLEQEVGLWQGLE